MIKIYLFLFSIVLTACSNNNNAVNSICSRNLIGVQIKNNLVISKTACSESQQEQGLMFVKEMNKDKGMIFVFNEEQKLSFWMKNTLIPLDIAYIDKDLNIVDIYTMKPLDLTPINSTKKVLYALEVNKGYFKEKNIKVGDKINFIY